MCAMWLIFALCAFKRMAFVLIWFFNFYELDTLCLKYHATSPTKPASQKVCLPTKLNWRWTFLRPVPSPLVPSKAQQGSLHSPKTCPQKNRSVTQCCPTVWCTRRHFFPISVSFWSTTCMYYAELDARWLRGWGIRTGLNFYFPFSWPFILTLHFSVLGFTPGGNTLFLFSLTHFFTLYFLMCSLSHQSSYFQSCFVLLPN